MNKYKVCAYAISKNESQFINRWVDCMKEADEIYVFDTGSTDNTVELLQKRGVIVQQEFLNPFKFDEARNKSLQMIPDDFDICFCTDIDETVSPNWREQLEKYWTPNATRARYKFVSCVLEDGTESLVFLNEKIHKRHGFEWRYAIHECLFNTGLYPENYVKIEGMQVEHHPDNNKSRGQYLGMMEDVVKHNPSDDRTTHLLGREYMNYKMWDKCIETCKSYLNAPTSTWKTQRSASMRYIANSYSELGQKEQALYWYLMSHNEAPHLREPLVDIVKFYYYKLKNSIAAEMYLDKVLDINTRGIDYYFAESNSWGSYIYHLGSVIKYNVKKYVESYYLILRAKDLSPNDHLICDMYKLAKGVVEDYYRT